MRTIRETIHYTAPTHRVAALYTNEAYGPYRASALPGAEATSTVTGDAAGGFTVTTAMSIDADHIPAKFRKFPISQLTLEEVQKWDAPEGDVYTGQTRITVRGIPARSEGTFRLEPHHDGSQLTLEGSLSVTIPLVGGALEKTLESQIGRVLAEEGKSAGRALSDGIA